MMTFFNYTPGKSLFHTQDSSVKIIQVLLLSLAIMTGSTLSLIISTGVVLTALIHSGITFRSLVRDIRALLILCLIITVLKMFSPEGERFFVSFLSREGFIWGVFYSWKMLLLLFTGSLFARTTPPEDIASGVFRIFRFMPGAEKLAEGVSLTLSLIPHFFLTWEKTHEALTARNYTGRKNPVTRIRLITVPLVIETFKLSDLISKAMESRCYSGCIVSKEKNGKIHLPLVLVSLLSASLAFILP